jgi:hypothetical protein
MRVGDATSITRDQLGGLNVEENGRNLVRMLDHHTSWSSEVTPVWTARRAL